MRQSIWANVPQQESTEQPASSASETSETLENMEILIANCNCHPEKVHVCGLVPLSLSLAHSLVMPEIEQNGWPPNYNKSSAYLHCLVALFSVMHWSSIYCSFLMLFEVSAPMHFQVSHITCPNQGTDWVRAPQYEQNRSALPMPLQLLHSWLPHPQSAWFVHQMASILDNFRIFRSALCNETIVKSC